MQALTGELIRQADVVVEIEGQGALVEQTVMQGAQGHGVGDRARPTGGVPADMRSVEADNAIAEAQAQTTEGTTAPVGLENLVGEARIALSCRPGAFEIEPYRIEDGRVQARGKRTVEELVHDLAKQGRILAQQSCEPGRKAARDADLPRCRNLEIPTGRPERGVVGLLQLPEAVGDQPAERLLGVHPPPRAAELA